MYFQKFPQTLYSLDDRKSVQVVTNILQRVIIKDNIKNNLSLFDEYDIIDGETPEIVAHKFYNNAGYHWLVLHMNDIIDPRFDWPLSTRMLNQYIQSKYADVNDIHHYEDTKNNVVNARVIIRSVNEFVNVHVGNVLLNQNGQGSGIVVDKSSNSIITVQVSTGGFTAADTVRVLDNTVVSNISSITIVTGIPITNDMYENTVNETKRRIKILKPQYVEAVVKEFNNKLGM
jgi:hypothetical protein